MILQGPSGPHAVSQVSFLLQLGHIEMHRDSYMKHKNSTFKIERFLLGQSTFNITHMILVERFLQSFYLAVLLKTNQCHPS